MSILDDLDGPGRTLDTSLRVAVIVPAAGRGARFAAGAGAALHDTAELSSGPTKIELMLGPRPVFMHALQAFCGRADVEQVILALAPERLAAFNDRYGERLDDLGVVRVPGAAAGRSETVARALARVDDAVTHVAVHDAARPLLSQAVIDRVFAAAARWGAAVPGLPVADTLVRRHDPQPIAADDPADRILGGAGGTGGAVSWLAGDRVDRQGLMGVQTPQVFEADLLRRAYARAGRADDPAAGATDDASRVAVLGAPVRVVEGDPALVKLTRAADAEILAALLAHRRSQEAQKAAKKALWDDDENG